MYTDTYRHDILILGLYDERRSSSYERPDFHGTKRARLAECNSSSTDDEWGGPSGSTGDSGHRRRTASSELTVYSELASRGRDFRVGGPRPCRRTPDIRRSATISAACNQLFTTPGPLFAGFESIQDWSEIPDDFEVDRSFAEPPVKEDYENFLSTLLYITYVLNI